MREEGKWEADMLAQQDQDLLWGEVLEELGLRKRSWLLSQILISCNGSVTAVSIRLKCAVYTRYVYTRIDTYHVSNIPDGSGHSQVNERSLVLYEPEAHTLSSTILQ